MPRTRTTTTNADRDAVRQEFLSQMTELSDLKDNIMTAKIPSDRKAAVIDFATAMVFFAR
jgi:hypothetical protein